MTAPAVANRVLVVKLGTFAGFVLAFGAFKAIRQHHADAYITLLTTPPFAELARRSGWFDEVWDDGDPPRGRIGKTIGLIRRLRGGGFHRVYDLDNGARTASYRFWMGAAGGSRAEWSHSGAVPPELQPGAGGAPVHYVEELVAQLAAAGIHQMPTPDLSWLAADFGGRYGLQDGFVIVAPGGGSLEGPGNWPTERYIELTRRVAIEGRRPVIVGKASEARINQLIAAASPEAMDLTGRTSLFDVAALATRAKVAVGNDSGIMHLISAVGCAAVVLSSPVTDPARYGPRGHYVVMVRKENLADLEVTEVAAALRLG